MLRPSPTRPLLALILTTLLYQGATLRTSQVRADDQAQRNWFEAKIRPVLVERCLACHSQQAGKAKGGLQLDNRASLLSGGDSGPAVVPGDPAASPLLQALTGDGLQRMPPDQPLPASTIDDFRAWIAQGAFDPRDTASKTRPTASGPWWSLLPVRSPSIPLGLPPDGWNRSSIDAFLLTRLNAAGLTPSNEADRRTLIRRLSFDLLGLPPTPEEIDAFQVDPAPDAYERLVDRLLASPHYGERSARLWMDLVHFAETHGHDQDRIRPNAWPYRDYLIRAFNADLPYQQFIEQQIAADVLFPQQPDTIEALGFLAAGPWDESSLRDIREDTLDREIGRYLDRDDMIATTMSTFISTTVHCARCHDHKFDPVSQADYYGLQAVFAGVDRADRSFDRDLQNGQRRREITGKLQAVEQGNPAALANLLEDKAYQPVQHWADSLQARAERWLVIKPDTLNSSSGCSFEPQDDASYLVTGNRPAKEITTISTAVSVPSLTAVRLEAMNDDRLPSKGPGRNENGNLHLTEVKIFLTFPDGGHEARPVRISKAQADFQQEGWGIAAAIDGNPQTAWGIFPSVARSHEAVFELAEDLIVPPGAKLSIELQQTFPENHPIGRFRISVSGAERPATLVALPPELDSAVRTPEPLRTPAQKQTLALAYWTAEWKQQLTALPPASMVYAGAADFAPDGSHKPAGRPRPIKILKRGDIKQPGDAALPGALQCIAELPGQFALPNPEDESARRKALALWISSPHNPLTWRSIVNRVWQQHFGRGIVDTPSDFGRMGSIPTHPELLDWLAATFRDQDAGSLKSLHRRIVTCSAYRQSVRTDPAAANLDAENRLLWRGNRRRLDAESVRDAILHASGSLDQRMGGPSVQHFKLSPGVHVTPVVDYTAYDWSNPGSGRRSVYRFLFRTLPDPFMEVLDAADGSQLTETRGESVSPLQSLVMLHNAFIQHFSLRMANNLQASSPDLEPQIDLAFQRLFGRAPEGDEQTSWQTIARKHGLAEACRGLLNTNEFLFVD